MNKQKIKEILIAILVIIVIGIKPISACICGGVSVEKAYEQSSMIFVGKVVEVKTYTDESDIKKLWLFLQDKWRIEATFEVSNSWKGSTLHRQVIYTDTSICDFDFKLNKQYLIYAHETSPNEFYAFKCYRTMSLERAAQDLLFLQRRSKFSQPSLVSQVQDNNLALSIFLIFSLFLLGFWLIKRCVFSFWSSSTSQIGK